MPYRTLVLALLAAGCLAGDTSVVDEPLDAADPIAVDDLLAAMAQDLETIAPADRADVRYVTLTHLHNAGASEADLETHRAAISLALNSLSRGRKVSVPVPVDKHATVFRIRLEDYGWDARTWQTLVDGYPYDVRYSEDSEWFAFRGDLVDDLRAETESPVPYVYGDWLVSAAMQPPLYHDLLGLPATLDALEHDLGIDTLQATADAQVDRAGFVDSTVSTADRMIARFELPDRRALWTSCDVASILDEPVDPRCERREVLFALPNGLPAYYAANDRGERQALAGLSCITCHAVTGTIPKNDQVRDFALSNGVGGSDLDDILALYPPRDEMSALMHRDQTSFVSARLAAGAPDTDPLTPVSARHDLPLDARDAAATLGLDEDLFRDVLAHGAVGLPAEALPLLRSNGTISRATWERIFADVVCALGIGSC